MKLRAGIIGLGVGESHIAGYNSHPGAQVVALCDIQDGVCKKMAEKYPGLRITQDPDALINDPQIDVVSIASYDNAHAGQVIAALRRNKHVFVEKPLCLNGEDAAAIRQALDENPTLRLSSNLIMRKYPRFTRLKSVIRQSELGELFYLEGDYNYGRLHKLTHGWRGEIEFYSVMCGGGVHLIDLMLWLTGRKIVEVFAYGNRIASRGTSFRFPDFVTAVMKFDNGLAAKVTANFGCVLPHSHGFKVFGTRGTFVNDVEGSRIYHSRERTIPARTLDDHGANPPKGDMIPSFVDSILGLSESECGIEDVFRSLSVCLAIDRSLTSGAPVPVKYF